MIIIVIYIASLRTGLPMRSPKAIRASSFSRSLDSNRKKEVEQARKCGGEENGGQEHCKLLMGKYISDTWWNHKNYLFTFATFKATNTVGTLSENSDRVTCSIHTQKRKVNSAGVIIQNEQKYYPYLDATRARITNWALRTWRTLKEIGFNYLKRIYIDVLVNMHLLLKVIGCFWVYQKSNDVWLYSDHHSVIATALGCCKELVVLDRWQAFYL